MKMMNERIEELAREAGHVYVGGHPVPYYQFSNDQLEKFAELIVRECCNIVRDEVQYINDFDKADAVITEVKKHFGVE
jgi:hypothetical protein